MKKLSVLLVEDSALFRIALANVFDENRTMNMRTCSSRSFLARIAKISEDAVVIDAVTWNADLQALVSAVEQTAMVAPVILLGREDMFEKHAEALRAGAAGFIKQTADPGIVSKQ